MKTCADTTINQLKTVLELETSPFTQNYHYFQECRDKWLSKYKDARAGKGPAERVTPAVVTPQAPTFSFSQCESPYIITHRHLVLIHHYGIVATGPATTTTAKPASDPKVSAQSSQQVVPGALTLPKPQTVSVAKPAVPATPQVQSTAVQPSAQQSRAAQNVASTSNAQTNSAPASSSTSNAAPATLSASPFNFAAAAPPRQPAVSPTSATSSITNRQQLVAETLANLAKLGYIGLQEEDFGKLNPPDIYEEELEVMAEVRAYFQVAYKVRAGYFSGLCRDLNRS